MDIINVESASKPFNDRSSTNSVPTRKGDYILGQTIGQGAFAKVKIGTHVYTQEKVAIKIFDKSLFVDNEKDVCRIQKEINILKRLRHKNIVQLYEIMESANHLYIIMDYCEGKELFDYIIKHNKLSEKKACRFFQQIINGVEYLHLQNITHRDLKPENLLLDNKENIVISDFGLSFVCSEPDCLLQTACGTPSYAPPEMLRGDKYLGAKSDIWSCGIILYTMLCGNLPCAESKEELIYQFFYNKSYDYPSHLSTSVIDLIKRLLKFDPEERVGFDQIKRHPWFNLLRPQMQPGIIVNVHKIPVDELILNKVEMFGYKGEDCRKSVSGNKTDHLCAIYYLILKQVMREGKKSISDMNSELYDNYIRNFCNWEQPEELKDKKYKDYWPAQRLNSRVIQSINSLVSPKNHSIQQLQEGGGESGDNAKFTLEKSSSQGQALESTKINLEAINPSVKITESNTSINSSNLFPFNIFSHNDSIALNNINMKQTTFTSSSKKQENSKSFYSYLTQNQRPISRSKKDKGKGTDSDTEEIASLKNNIEYLNDSNKKSLLLKLETKISLFNNDIKSIDSFNWNNISNCVPLIAKKLIKTTIFSKYLSSKKLNRMNKGELEERFYKLQKYKELVETIKLTRKNIFPKKILDWNYYTFEVFLNDKEDFIFSDAHNKSNLNASFIKKVKKSIKNDKRVPTLRKYYLSKHILTRSADRPTLKSTPLIDQYSSDWKANHNLDYKYQYNNRLNRFLLSPSHLLRKDNSIVTRSGSKSYKSIHQESRDKCSIRNFTSGSNYSYSSMNNISEDEEWIKANEAQSKKVKPKRMLIGGQREPINLFNNKFDIKPRSKHIDYLYSPSRPQQIGTPLYDGKKYSSHKSYTDILCAHKEKSPPISMCPRNESFNLRQVTLTSQQKQKQIVSIFPQENRLKTNKFGHDYGNDNSNDGDEEDNYDGPIVDCRCIFQSSRNILLPLLKQYFRQNDYFFNHISEYQIKCSKANTQFGFELMNLKGTSMAYIRITKSKGGNREYVKILKGLLNSLPI